MWFIHKNHTIVGWIYGWKNSKDEVAADPCTEFMQTRSELNFELEVRAKYRAGPNLYVFYDYLDEYNL